MNLSFVWLSGLLTLLHPDLHQDNVIVDMEEKAV